MDDEYPGSSADSRHSPAADFTDSGSVSSATSPSSRETFQSPSRGPSGISNLPQGALIFFSDIDNYLALGCLCFEDLAELDDDQDTGVWRDVTHLPLLHVFDGSFYSHLQRLSAAGWIRIFSARSSADPRFLIFRIYVLPFDVGLRFIDRQSKRLYLALESLIADIDISEDAWQGKYVPEKACKFDMWATKDEGSLFWMFNKLPSPSPCADLVEEKYAHEALEDLLDPASVLPGLKTQLYPYQRRSAGLMLQRESVSTLELDPRFERRTAPDGSCFYFGARDLLFLRHPRYYENCKGGVLAETMGLGKTVISLALILATKDHPPKVPLQFAMPPVRSSVASLADMTVSAIHRKSVPWRVEFQRIKHATGAEMGSCHGRLEQSPASYEIPVVPMRWNRKTILPPPKTMALAPTTLIVVPRNLCKQWQSEIRKHVDEDVLRVLVMDDTKTPLPAPDELRSYDIVLFTRGRFEFENRDGADNQGRRLGITALPCQCFYIGASRTRNCNCIRADELYDSPLKHLHFKRLIIDEGHFFSNTNNAAVSVANRLVTADHLWVVSGTPAKDLLGVEVDISAAENLWHTPNTKDSRDAVLEQRRYFSGKDDANGAIKSLGSLASSFLKIKPWAPGAGERRADWEEYIYRHEGLRKKTHSGFSTCLKRILEGMVVKTRAEDVERDIKLPPLSHEVVRLEPSFYDKLTANLFTLVLTANAVTSERTDVDYLFHKNSQKARSQLISNLRQSAFFWTGFSDADVQASLKSSNAYLSKEGINCSETDRKLLTETLAIADTILESSGWKSLSRSHELGLFIDNWPSESAEHWTFDESQTPLLTGITQLLEAQKHINDRTSELDPGEGLAGAGIRAVAPAKYGAVKKEISNDQKAEKPILTKSGIPTSSIDGEPVLRRRASVTTKGGKYSPKKSPGAHKVVMPEKEQSRLKRAPQNEDLAAASLSPSTETAKDKAEQAAKHPDILEEDAVSLPEDSRFLQGRIVGTTSAKLSYLISQILKHYRNEKILVFYDGDNVAYYIAQMLDVLHIKHEIYAKSLAAHLKAEYVVRFDQEVEDRVLLMDVRQAAFGLNVSSASRIYFLNPVCRPNIEAQAIKRAHRIGQMRKIYVETLVLKGAIEEKMLERSKRMTRAEHHDAKSLEDDGGIREIIQSAKVMPMAQHERSGYGQMAPLEEPQQLWGRPGWRQFSSSRVTSHPRKRKGAVDSCDVDEEGFIEDGVRRGKKVVRRTLAFVDCTRSENWSRGDTCTDEGSAQDSDEPILDQWCRRSLTTTVTPLPVAVITRAEDPFLPPYPYSLNIESHSRTLVPSDLHTHTAHSRRGPSPTLAHPKLAISQLLNDEPASGIKSEQPSPELLREIIRRL